MHIVPDTAAAAAAAITWRKLSVKKGPLREGSSLKTHQMPIYTGGRLTFDTSHFR